MTAVYLLLGVSLTWAIILKHGAGQDHGVQEIHYIQEPFLENIDTADTPTVIHYIQLIVHI